MQIQPTLNISSLNGLTRQPLQLRWASSTHAGLVRANNEDSLGWDEDAQLFVVADGMGGCNAGEVASRLAVRALLSEFRQLPLALPGRNQTPALSAQAVRLCSAISKANRVVFDASFQEEHYAGMGTTLVAALFRDEWVTIASIGDSRVYRVRDGNLEQLTVDHTVLQEQVEFGLISPEQARLMAGRGLITRALGVEAGVEVDVQEQPLRRGDIYLLCTDGLFDMISDARISGLILDSTTDLSATANALVESANAAGGYDNISLILARVA